MWSVRRTCSENPRQASRSPASSAKRWTRAIIARPAGLHEGDGRAFDHDLGVVALEQLTDALADLPRVADVDVACQVHGGRTRCVRAGRGHRGALPSWSNTEESSSVAVGP